MTSAKELKYPVLVKNQLDSSLNGVYELDLGTMTSLVTQLEPKKTETDMLGNVTITTIKELDFTVVAEAFEHYVDYKVYNVVGWGDGAQDQPIWNKAGSDLGFDPVYTLEESEVYLSGGVKWDGCSNWQFDEQDRCMLHACSRDGLVRLGEIMARCWDMTSQLCPAWNL